MEQTPTIEKMQAMHNKTQATVELLIDIQNSKLSSAIQNQSAKQRITFLATICNNKHLHSPSETNHK
jgi:hypothetical protein